MAAELESVSGLDAINWSKKLYSEINRVDKLSDEEVIKGDLKEYVSGEVTFAVSQVETVDLRLFAERRAKLLSIMEQMCAARGYVLMCLMVTNIFQDGTEIIVAGQKGHLVEDAFSHQHLDGGIFLKGILSRKKQVVPVIYQALRQERSIV